jgi:hypothetical protein
MKFDPVVSGVECPRCGSHIRTARLIGDYCAGPRQCHLTRRWGANWAPVATESLIGEPVVRRYYGHAAGNPGAQRDL